MALEYIDAREAVETYVEEHLVHTNPGLNHIYETNAERGLPAISVSPVQGKFTSLLATLGQARNILEIGVLGGYSTLWFAQTLKKGTGGKVTSIEIDSERRDIAVENLRSAGVKVPEEVDVILGAGLDVLPKLAEEIDRGVRERFDFVFIDGDWDNQWNYFDYAVKLSKGKGTVIYIDNAVRSILRGGVVGPEERRDDVADLVAKIGEDKRVEAVVMQTVGVKRYDGFLLAIVN